ncbi:phospho-sugar mutase [Rhodocytophaga aerolata]|uniref:Phospho-sugar mutase n=1 Tax=Rhodocytophaga aerolata TaxID=455078 RepID=A0ABT8R217_9BACT|nr:phospho-sugar mutase [Rhodocytophaga aerolata]MDO1445954.1 phospho-sugar mutase [Rhodocytophaga aerolata]
METAIRSKIDTWLTGNYDDDTKKEIQQLLDAGNETELSDAFYKALEFGTGGLRGTIGVGSNRMNKYTVGMATQGLANYLKQSFPGEQIKVAIAHDSRNKSDYFARITADVFSANGFKVYFFKELRPTPELSFAVRHLGCHSGVVITASHNPKEYNGYKAYWNDGAQMISPHDKNVIKEVEKIQSVDEVKFNRVESNIELIGEEIDKVYIDKILSLSISKEAIKRQKDLKIVFTPIHGTGITLVPNVLEKMGFTNVTVVQEQATPDGNFPTVVYPNPEEKEAMSLAVKKAEELDADLVMATDPDSDRVGIAVKNHHGKFQLMNGNQTGSLLIYYMLRAWKEAGKITGKEYVVKTIVTTDLIDKMAESFGVECFNTLTGFKYIAGIIRELEGKKQFIAGGEESYGYLVGDFVRDKDAIVSCAMIAELVAYAKDKGVSLFDMLMEMYQQYGCYYETLVSLTKKGMTGAQEIKQMMTDLRNNPPKTINGSPLVALLDYDNRVKTDIQTGKTSPMEFEKSNVLQFITADGSKISARPSGTEPKIKFYFSVNAPLTNKEDFDKVMVQLDEKVKSIVNEMNLK